MLKISCFTFIITLFFSYNNYAKANDYNISKRAIAKFLGVPEEFVSIECPQQSFKLNGTGRDATLSICLNKADNQKRCEIAVGYLKKPPYSNHISFEAKVAHNTDKIKEWMIALQIHAFPDKGESWRCPALSADITGGKLHMFNRWDASKISKTHGYHCAEKGSSIQSRTVIDNYSVGIGKWFSLNMDLKLSHLSDGNIDISLNNDKKINLSGANTYNDDRPPFLKLGIYKPNGWDKNHILSCISYRNVDISVEKY